jgi:hypothetical protein
VADQCAGARVVAQHRRAESADARGECAVPQGRGKRDADATALPGVDHLDRHLGHVELFETDVARDPDRRPRQGRERDHRLVVPVVDGEEPGQLPGGEVRFGGHEALVARAFAQTAEGEHDRVAIGGEQLADVDLILHT